MLGETKNQFSLTRAASSTCGRTKSDFLSVIIERLQHFASCSLMIPIMRITKNIFMICLGLCAASCKTETFETEWSMDKAQWKPYTLDQVEVMIPLQLPLRTVGNGTWYFLIRRGSDVPNEEVVISCGNVTSKLARGQFEKYKSRLESEKSVTSSTWQNDTFQFASPSGYINNDKRMGITPETRIIHSSFGYSTLLEDKLICSVYLSKSHVPVSFQRWKYEGLFSLEERRLIEEIAKTVILKQ